MPRAVRLLLPLLSGFLVMLSFPGWNHGQLAWVALVPLLISLPSATLKASFNRGFLAGLLANLGALYWIYPTCRAGGVNVPVSGLALLALAAYCAVYWGLFALAVHRSDSFPPAWRPFAVAAAWAGLEWVRAHFLSGFPWLLFAYSQWNVPQHLPLAEVGGPYIVSFMLVLFNGMAAEAWRVARGRCPRELLSVLPSFLALVGLVAASVVLSKRARFPSGPALEVAVVQGNIDQYKKWDKAYEDEIMETYARLTREAAREPVDLIVWPETAVPGWFPNDPRFVAWVSDLTREVKTPLLVGAVTRDGGDYNAAFLVDPSGKIAARYRKRHLVPFGEVVPFHSVLGRWVPALGALGNFDASDDWTVFRLSSGTFGVNVCFESLFPELVRGFVKRGAGFTVNLTNDGWFLDTAAAEQHFAAAPFRAVENRAWVVCATNTGVSAFVDPSGRVAARLAPGAPGVLRARLAARAGD